MSVSKETVGGSLRDFGSVDLGDVYVSLLRFSRDGCKEYACLGRKGNKKFNRFATNITQR
jgi:hypothetical protein